MRLLRVPAMERCGRASTPQHAMIPITPSAFPTFVNAATARPGARGSVRRGDLDADPRLALRHDRVEQALHVDALLEQRLREAPLAQRFAKALLEEGVYVKGFFYPVVPKGQSRIRVQISAAHEPAHLERAVAAFTKVGKALGVIG